LAAALLWLFWCAFSRGGVQESGSLLLWEGNFIKLEIGRTDGTLPHQGPITAVHLDRASNQFITAGEDGCVVAAVAAAVAVVGVAVASAVVGVAGAFNVAVEVACCFCCCCCCCCCYRLFFSCTPKDPCAY
jgi:hypothetical protein